MSNITSLQIGENKIQVGDLIDSYHNANNTEGYRVYKDGWCECYGTVSTPHVTLVTVDLPKAFKNGSGVNNEVITYTPQVGAGSPSTLSGAFISSNQIQVFQMNTANSSIWVKYIARGYLTDEEMSAYNL